MKLRTVYLDGVTADGLVVDELYSLLFSETTDKSMKSDKVVLSDVERICISHKKTEDGDKFDVLDIHFKSSIGCEKGAYEALEKITEQYGIIVSNIRVPHIPRGMGNITKVSLRLPLGSQHTTEYVNTLSYPSGVLKNNYGCTAREPPKRQPDLV